MQKISYSYKGIRDKGEKRGFVGYYKLQDTYQRRRTNVTSNCIDYRILYDQTAQNITEFPLNERLKLAFSDVRKLKDDWDSYGAIAPESKTILLAEQVCEKFEPNIQPEISPEHDGSIGLYWDFDSIYCIKVKDQKEVLFNWFVESSDGNICEGEPLSLEEVSVVFKKFIKDKLNNIKL
ncbi:MAG: hypothetical protein KBC84_01655 [Proteobacteria bacterium]|nr:hypothetical protein [Pseudomonadota bacterium]